MVVAALGTVYALSGADDDAVAQGLAHLISADGTGWSLRQRFVFAGVVYLCAALLGNIGNGTPWNGSWKHVAVMTAYLFGLAC